MKLSRLSFLALLVPSIAAAHIGISGPAIAKKSQKVTFAINHGCTVTEDNKLDTLSIQIDIPAGIDGTSVRPMPSDFDGNPAVSIDGDAVASVKWTRDPADLQDGDFAYYEITLKLKVEDVPFTRIPFVITQVCRPAGGNPDGSEDVTVLWTGPETNPEPSPELVVVPAHSPGWNKLTLTTAVAAADFGTYFGDALILWKDKSAFSPNAAVSMLITMTTGVTLLETDLAAGDEIWVKY